MATNDYFIELIGSSKVRINAHEGGLVASTRQALSGWYSTPDEKVESTERQSGHGAFNVTSDMVLYSSRTVTIDLLALGLTRNEIIDLIEDIQPFAGQIVKVRVKDAKRDTYATGYLTTQWASGRYDYFATCTITIVCPDPRRYANSARTAVLTPMFYTNGGLMFDDNACLMWPVQFYGETESGNTAILYNNGTTTAYPTITVSGSWPSGVILNTSQGQLWYKAAISWQALKIDCKTRTASINGVDVTRNFASRDFPSIKPGGNVRFSCLSGGTGSITLSVRDTYL